jgi:hypothetical protein
VRAFAPGWLENESIWMHMEYKYLLELLRAGLFAEYFQELRRTLVPFLSPARYGRSIYENSSFIASSAHPDPDRHGKGYYARLSGSTAEFMHMWRLMMIGPAPFALGSGGELVFRFRPALPADWFLRRSRRVTIRRRGLRTAVQVPVNGLGFMFLGETWVTYRNPRRRPTFGPRGVKVVRMVLTDRSGRRVAVEGGELSGAQAEAVRRREFASIEAFLG